MNQCHWLVMSRLIFFHFYTRQYRFVQSSCISTQKTQEFDDESNVEESKPTESNIWGRLLSINKLFPSINLIDQAYSLGRGKTCSIVLSSDELQTSKYFLAYSSTHLKIVRDETQHLVFIEDLSSNGTYINGDKIGKNKRQILETNDEIALASKTNRAYVYVDAKASEDTSIPAVVREKYIISKEIGRGAYGEVKLCFARGRHNHCDG
jgi:serine/threonine-protein kinase CHEK2